MTSRLVVEIATVGGNPADRSTIVGWKELSISQSLGQPDTATVTLHDMERVLSTALSTGSDVQELRIRLTDEYSDYSDEYLFRGPILPFTKRTRGSDRHGAGKALLSYTITAKGWDRYLPLRLVGIPDGGNVETQPDGQGGTTDVWIDPSAFIEGGSDRDNVIRLFDVYWGWPPIDVDTYVEEVTADLGTSRLDWSGTTLDGALADLAALANPAIVMYFAPDAPDPANVAAVHWTLIDPAATIDPYDPHPSNLAPFEIDNDNPDWIGTIMADDMEVTINHENRRDGAFLRAVSQDAIGWVGSPLQDGHWGSDYLDAPGAQTALQKGAFGGSYLAARAHAQVSGNATITRYDGWRKGQLLFISDLAQGLSHYPVAIRSVNMVPKDPQAAAMEYRISFGDVEDPSLAYAQRRVNINERRKSAPAGFHFVPYTQQPNLEPGGSGLVSFQYAEIGGPELKKKGITVVWELWVNGVAVADPTDTGEMFFLTDVVYVTDAGGLVTATLNKNAAAAAIDAGLPRVVPP